MKKTDTLFEAINTAHIKNNAITTSKLNDGSVTTEKILNFSITNNKIEDNTILPNKLADKLFAFKQGIVVAENITAKKIILSADTPIEIVSREKIKNLNAEFLQGFYPTDRAISETIVARDKNNSILSQRLLLTEQEEAPLVILSTKEVKNLNVELLGGYKASNLKGSIPISNSMLNEGLNSEFLNGVPLSRENINDFDENITTSKILYNFVKDKYVSTDVDKNFDWDNFTDFGICKTLLNGLSLNGPKNRGIYYCFNMKFNDDVIQFAFPYNTQIFSNTFFRSKVKGSWSVWKFFTVNKPLSVGYNTKDIINNMGHTHAVDDSILNTKTNQIVDGEKFFKNIKTNKTPTADNDLINKKFFDDRQAVTSEIVGMKMSYENPTSIVVSGGECFDSTYTIKLKLPEKAKKTLTNGTFNEFSGKNGLFTNVNLEPFATYFVFIVKKDNSDYCTIGIDNNIDAMNRAKGWTYYRRIGCLLTDEKSSVVEFSTLGNKTYLKQPKATTIKYFRKGKETIRLFVPNKIRTIPLFKINHDVSINIKSFVAFAFYDYISNNTGSLLFEADEDLTDFEVKTFGWEDYLR